MVTINQVKDTFGDNSHITSEIDLLRGVYYTLEIFLQYELINTKFREEALAALKDRVKDVKQFYEKREP